MCISRKYYQVLSIIKRINVNTSEDFASGLCIGSFLCNNVVCIILLSILRYTLGIGPCFDILRCFALMACKSNYINSAANNHTKPKDDICKWVWTVNLCHPICIINPLTGDTGT